MYFLCVWVRIKLPLFFKVHFFITAKFLYLSEIIISVTEIADLSCDTISTKTTITTDSRNLAYGVSVLVATITLLL